MNLLKWILQFKERTDMLTMNITPSSSFSLANEVSKMASNINNFKTVWFKKLQSEVDTIMTSLNIELKEVFKSYPDITILSYNNRNEYKLVIRIYDVEVAVLICTVDEQHIVLTNPRAFRSDFQIVEINTESRFNQAVKHINNQLDSFKRDLLPLVKQYLLSKV